METLRCILKDTQQELVHGHRGKESSREMEEQELQKQEEMNEWHYGYSTAYHVPPHHYRHNLSKNGLLSKECVLWLS